jgi:hypothetical protein
VTQATDAGTTIPGHFDVVVDAPSMTFLALDGGPTGAEGAIWINARNEVITFAYIHSLAVPRPKPGKPKSKLVTLAQAQFIPTNHAPRGKETDKGAPSSSLIPKTGIPPDVPAKDVVLSVIPFLFVDHPTPEAPKNGERVRALLWGITVPTTTMDTFAINNSANGIPALMYGEVLAHEVGHVLGLRHRVPPGVKAEPAADGPDPFPDGQRVPREKNMMYPIIHDVAGQNFDIVQLKATRESVVLERKP